MTRKKAIVKRLDAIQDIGAMDVLCTDKTGTLTMDTVILERYCDAERRETDRVLLDALLISHSQTGLKSALDVAVLQHEPRHPELHLELYRKVDEIPFDFSRRMMSVVVETPTGGLRLLAKGAPEEVLSRCTSFEIEGVPFPTEPAFIDALREEYDALSAQGFRVLAIAHRDVSPKPAFAKDDECDLVLAGYIAFLDPPKETAEPAIAALVAAGIRVKVLTGDNELVTRTICTLVRLEMPKVRADGCELELREHVQRARRECAAPFIPMAPIQVLMNNLLYDCSQVPIPTDNVDPEQIARPRPWHIGEIGRYIVTIGPLSSIFDYTTYAVMWLVFAARTPAHAASWPQIATTVTIMAVGLWLPLSPFAAALGFVALRGAYWPLLALTLLCYVALTQMVKMLLVRRHWI